MLPVLISTLTCYVSLDMLTQFSKLACNLCYWQTATLSTCICLQIKHRSRFLSFSPTDAMNQLFLWGGGDWPVHYKVFSSIPGRCSREASSIPSSCDNQICLQILPKAP